MPFFMVYGAEAVLPDELRFGAPPITDYEEEEAQEALEDSQVASDEAKEIALSRAAAYQQKLRTNHSRRLCTRTFNVGDLVLRLKQKKVHKLASPWEGLYIVTEVLGGGAYRLKDPKTGAVVSNSWNVAHLRLFYV